MVKTKKNKSKRKKNKKSVMYGGNICRHNRNLCFGNNKQFYEDTKNELIKFYNLLQNLGLTVFLDGGTLLGYAREHNLMANDDDICLSLIEYENSTDIVENLFQNHGYNKMIYSGKLENGGLVSNVRKDNYKNENTIFKQFTFSKKINGNLVEFDINVLHLDPIKQYFVETNYNNNTVQFYLHKPFNLKQVYFLNNYFYIPEEYDTFLKGLYGNWRIENPLFKWSDTPCIDYNYNYNNLIYFTKFK